MYNIADKMITGCKFDFANPNSMFWYVSNSEESEEKFWLIPGNLIIVTHKLPHLQ